MRVEEILRALPCFSKITVDKVLFESRYPIMFTCRDEQKIFLFICCLVTSEKIKWIATKTTYDNLIMLLENKITIRDAFLNCTNEKMIICYDGSNAECRVVKSEDIPVELLPSAGEYMDAEEEEYTEEINDFKIRSLNLEYMIRQATNIFYMLNCGRRTITLEDDFFYDTEEKITQCKVEQFSENKIMLV